MSLIYRIANSNDYPNINNLKKEYHELTRTASQWHWEYSEKPEPQSMLMVIEDGDNILATQALHPFYFRQNQHVFLTAKSEETFLQPSLRGKGIFPEMMEKVFSYADEHNIQAIWGITGLRKPFLSAGFVIPYDVLRYRIALNSTAESSSFPLWKYAKLLKNTASSNYSFLSLKNISARGLSYDKDFSGSIDVEFASDLWKAVARRFVEVVSINRTTEYLEWRLNRNPWVTHHMIRYAPSSSDRGYLIYSVNQSGGMKVVDALALGRSTFIYRTLYEEMIRQAQERNCIEIVDYFVQNECILTTQRLTALKSLLFITRPLYTSFVFWKNPNIKNLSADKMMFHEFNLIPHEKRYLCVGSKNNLSHLDINLWYFTGLFLEGIS